MTRPANTISNTHPDAARVLSEMAREAPVWQKAYMAGPMYETVKT